MALGLCWAGSARAARQRLAVVYPEVAEPYRTAFQAIVQGLQEQLGSELQLHRVAGDTQAASLGESLRTQADLALVIALGRQGIKLAQSLPAEVAVLGSGVVLPPTPLNRPMQIVSLAPDPEALFMRLKKLAPAVRRVHMVYDPQHNAWLQRAASQAAKEQQLALLSSEAGELVAATRFYQGFIDRADPQQDALWLPQDPSNVQDSVVLPLLLRGAWDRRLLIFSSNLNHVRNGLLFALYPDNQALGRQLGRLSADLLGQPARASQVLPTRALRAALNLKTADHLDLRLSQKQLDEFQLFFPEP